MRRLWLTLAAGGILAATPVRAQDISPPRVEIGGSVSGLLSIVNEDSSFIIVGAGPRITLNVTPKVGVDVLAEVLGPLEFSGTTALYQAQLKLAIGKSRDGKGRTSFTVGAAGAASYQHARETRIVRLDGSTVVYPEYRRWRARAPKTISVGMAHERVLSRYASTCLAIQGYVGPLAGIAVRGSFGVSFGIGGYR